MRQNVVIPLSVIAARCHLSPRRGKKVRLKLTRAINISQHNPQSSPSAMPAPLTLRPSLSQAMRREKLLVVLMSLCDAGSI